MATSKSIPIKKMTNKQRLGEHDKQIAAIRDLVREGMRLVVETRKDIRKLTAIQRKASEDVQTLVNSLKRGANGHGKAKYGLRF